MLNADGIDTLKQLIHHDMIVEVIKMVRKITGLGLVVLIGHCIFLQQMHSGMTKNILI